MDISCIIPHFPVSVHLFLMCKGKVLLMQRFNTGFEDGNYCLVAGKLEENESVSNAMIREAKEEIGIQILEMHVVHVMSRLGIDGSRIDFFLAADKWLGTPINKEPDKCCNLSWFDRNSLPTNTIPYIKQAIIEITKGNTYSEFGWDNHSVK